MCFRKVKGIAVKNDICYILWMENVKEFIPIACRCYFSIFCISMMREKENPCA